MDVNLFIFLQVALYLGGGLLPNFLLLLEPLYCRVEQFCMLYDLLLTFLGKLLFFVSTSFVTFLWPICYYCFQFGALETLLTAVLDKRPKLLPKKPLVALVICSSMFLLGLSTVTQVRGPPSSWQNQLWGLFFIVKLFILKTDWWVLHLSTNLFPPFEGFVFE